MKPFAVTAISILLLVVGAPIVLGTPVMFVINQSALTNPNVWINPHHDPWMGDNQGEHVLDRPVGPVLVFVANTNPLYIQPIQPIQPNFFWIDPVLVETSRADWLGGVPLILPNPSLRTTDPIYLALGAQPYY